MGPYGDAVAMAAVTIGGAFTGAVLGFSGVVLAANVFTLTLATGYAIDPVDASITASTATASNAMNPHVTHVSDTSIEVRCFGADGALSARAFHIMVRRKAVG